MTAAPEDDGVSSRVSVSNPYKLAIAALAIVCLTILRLFDAIAPEVAGTGIVGIAMYVLGNGINAVRGKVTQPVISPARSITTPHAVIAPAALIDPQAIAEADRRRVDGAP